MLPQCANQTRPVVIRRSIELPYGGSTSALPAAQNLYTYASQYGVGERLARDSILVSTVLSVPVLVVVAALLG